MVLTSASFQAISFAETNSHSFAPQVSTFLFEFKAFRRKSLALGAEPSALYKPKGLVARAHGVTQSSDCIGESNPSPETEAGKGLKGLLFLRDAFQRSTPQSHGAEYLHDKSRQGLQKFSGLQTEAQPKKVAGLEQQRHHMFSDPPARLQQDPHTGSGSSPVDRHLSGASKAITRKKEQPPKQRGSRNSSRGFDVLDELMSSQGRSSMALLESLQSEVAYEKDVMLDFGRDPVADALTSPFQNQKFPSRNGVGEKHGGMSQWIADSGRVQRWQPIYEDATDTASSSFASSIEKALSPSLETKSKSATNTSSRNASAKQQSTGSSQQLEGFSDVPQPGLRGQEVLWALQKAAMEKAKQKQKSRKPNVRAARGKQSMSISDSGEWRNAKPIVLKPEWALQMDDLERRIEMLKNTIPSS